MRNDFEYTFKKLMSSGLSLDVVYDIGANKGNWTRKYKSLFSRTTFHMFEANPTHNIESCNKGVGHSVVLSSPDKPEVDFYSINGTGDSYYKELTEHFDGVEPKKMKATTLDAYIAETNIPLPDVVKIDTQGSELDIIAGASDAFKGVKILMSEVPSSKYNSGAPSHDDYINTFYELGFVPVGVEEIHISNNVFVQLDIVCVRANLKKMLK